MITRSVAYANKIDADERRTRPLIICDFNPALEVYPFASAVADSEYDATHDGDKAVNGRVRVTDYTCDGHTPNELDDEHEGFWSLVQSDVNGDLSADVVLTITYVSAIQNGAYFVIGYPDNFPVDFKIEISEDNITYTTVVNITGNTLPIWTYRESEQSVKYMKITFTKISKASSELKVIQAGVIATVVFDYYDINYIKLLEEMSAVGNNPLGTVASNSCEFELINEADFLNSLYTSSPFNVLFSNNFRFRPYIGLETSADAYYFIPLGVFWADGYNLKTDEISAGFVGYDKIKQIKDLPPPILAVVQNTTVGELLEYLWDGLGYTSSDYDISSELYRTEIPWGFFAGEVGSNFSGETVGEVLQVLAEAGICYITTDRTGKFKAETNFYNGVTVDTLSDTDFIFTAKQIQNPINFFQAVKCRYRLPMPFKDEEIVFETNDYVIPNGGGEPLELEFGDAVGFVTSVDLLEAVNSYIGLKEIGAVRSRLTFGNSGVEEAVNIRIYGKTLQFYNASYYQENVDNPNKILNISNWLIQSKEQAISYVDSLLQYISEKNANYQIEERGDPCRVIGDCVYINDGTNLIYKTVQIIKQEIKWEGVLSSILTVRKAIAEQKYSCFIPGLAVLQPITSYTV